MNKPATEKLTAGALSASATVWREIAIVTGLCAFLFFYGLGSFGLIGADEPRYAQIAREMLQRHDWVVPVLNGKPWLEKPVLFYWEAMLSYSVFGVSDWAARLPNAFSATAMVFAIYLFVRRFRRGFQFDAALIMASMAAVIGFARAASTDMPLMTTFTLAMLAWATWYATQRKRWLAVFYAFMGLGMLAKGPVAPFLAALIIVPFALFRRDLSIMWRTLWPRGILLFFAIALPWYIAVQSRVPEFFRVFILEHNLARYGSNLYRHHQPFWYYIPVILAALLPWTVLAIAGLVTSIRGYFTHPRTEQEREPDKAFALLFVLWAVLPIVFFSFSGSKLPGYILPAVPGFVLLTLEWLFRTQESEQRVHPALTCAHAAVASVVLAVALLCQFIVYRSKPTVQAYAVAGVITGLVSAVSVALLFLRGPKVLRFVTLIPVLLGIGFVLKTASPAIDGKQSARPVARKLESMGVQSVPVAGFGIRRELEYGLAFYLNRPIPMYDRADIPSGEHILVTPRGYRNALAALIPARRITPLHSFAPQGLEIFRVEASK